MNCNVLLLFFISALSFGQSTKLISGQVTDGHNPLEKAIITNLDSGEDFLTDALGRYTAEAKIGDYLSYSYQGMDTIKIKIEDITRFLNIKLNRKTNQLKEVTVTGEKKSAREKEIEMMLSPTSVRTAYGYIDPNRSASNTRVINLEKDPFTYFCLTQMLRSKFQELTVFGSCSSYEANAYLRGRGSIRNPQPILYDVDGQILTQMPLFLSSAEIKRVALIRDVATRTRYGALGAGGVLVINTFIRKPVLDSAENANNMMDDVTEQSRLLADWDQVNGEPEYVTALKTASSIDSARQMYEDMSKRSFVPGEELLM